MFISEDPIRDGANWYAYCSGNPVMFMDPWGLEFVAISGGEYRKDRDGEYNYEFIETALKKITEWRDEYPDENITWCIANEGWSKEEWSRFQEATSGLNVNVVVINSSSDLINYINYKSTAGAPEYNDIEVNNKRLDDKITKLIVFSHGLTDGGGTISLGYNYESTYNTSLNISKSDIKRISADSFDSPNSAFYACNLATAGNDSFAKAWSDKMGGSTWAFVNKSNYEKINSPTYGHPFIWASRKMHGFSYYGSANYPVAGKNAYMVQYP